MGKRQRSELESEQKRGESRTEVEWKRNGSGWKRLMAERKQNGSGTEAERTRMEAERKRNGSGTEAERKWCYVEQIVTNEDDTGVCSARATATIFTRQEHRIHAT